MTINIDYSQDGNSLFENVYITGLLDYDFSGDNLIVNNLEIDNDAAVTKGLIVGGSSTVGGSLDISKNLVVGGQSYFTGIATFKDTVNFNESLSFIDLEIRDRLKVGVGGTVLTASSLLDPGKVGIGSTQPNQLLDVGGIGIFHKIGIGNTSPRNILDVVGTSNFDGSVGIGTTIPFGAFQINDETKSVVVTAGGTMAIGSTTPYGSWSNYAGDGGFNDSTQGTLRLSIDGSVRIGRNIYDSGGSAGVNGMFLQRDGTGIRWTAFEPSLQEGILIQDEGTFVPVNVGTAQTFSIVNFSQINSYGTGTNTLVPTLGNAATGLATIFTNDFWGVVEDHVGLDTGIYRMTNVGIGTTVPVASLQVGAASSAFAVSGLGSVGIGTTNPLAGLDVHYHTNLRSTLEVNGTSTFVGFATFSDIRVGGATTLVGITTTINQLFVGTDFNVGGATTLAGITTTINQLFVGSDFSVGGATTLTGITTVTGENLFTKQLSVAGITTIESTTDPANDTATAALNVSGGAVIEKKVFLKDITSVTKDTDATNSTTAAFVVTGGVGIGKKLFVDGDVTLNISNSNTTTVKGILNATASQTSTNPTSGSLQVTGGAGISENLNVGGKLNVTGLSTFVGVSTFQDEVGIAKTLSLQSNIVDVNNDTGFSDEVGVCKTDYRLASVGTGVSWRPSGVQTKNTIWVSINGCDTNTGLLEGDSKRTIGGAAAIAEAGDTIIVRSGVYNENNPIGLRTDVTVSGEDLRLVTVVPNNTNKDVFQVRRGCLIQNMNFAGQSTSTGHINCGAVAFPPTAVGISGGVDFQAVTGYTELGPANEGPNGRYRSPYVRNCTNFMTGSIGMKINGDYVNAEFTGVNDIGQDLKSMVCDSFTQYNEAGIGVSLTNNAYAQLVSIFTIGCDIAIFAGSGGQCDLTNSNSSFGNFGLKADGIGDVEFTGTTNTTSIAGQDTIAINNLKDESGAIRKPFDGQGAYFKIDLDNYPDALGSGTITAPLQLIRSIDIVDGGSGYTVGSPPNVTITEPQGPEAIIPEFSANVGTDGSITSIDVISSGRNFLADQDFTLTFSNGNASATVNIDPILFTISEASEPDTITGLSNVTFNEFIPYNLNSGVDVDFSRLSRIITSSHSFEYVGAGTDLNKANPFQGGEPIPENEIVAINGGQIPFTSTDQKGNFRIGEGLTIDQTTSTITGRDFNRAIQAQLTPLILALR